MSTVWPPLFPSPTLQSYSVSPDESIARTKMESGAARQRRRFTSTPSRVNLRWVMDARIFGLFEAWYHYKAKEGAEWIEIDLKNGFGYVSNQARFLAPYSAKLLSGDIWEVVANLEVREMKIADEATLDFALDANIDITNLVNLANDLNDQISKVTPPELD